MAVKVVVVVVVAFYLDEHYRLGKPVQKYDYLINKLVRSYSSFLMSHYFNWLFHSVDYWPALVAIVISS